MTKYINVDLEIRSRSKLDALAAGLTRKVFVLHLGRVGGVYLLSMETTRQYKSPDAAIRALCAGIESFPPSLQELYLKAHKVFDIGYESKRSVDMMQISLRPDTLQRIAGVGATVAVTVYPVPRRKKRKR